MLIHGYANCMLCLLVLDVELSLQLALVRYFRDHVGNALLHTDDEVVGNDMFDSSKVVRPGSVFARKTR